MATFIDLHLWQAQLKAQRKRTPSTRRLRTNCEHRKGRRKRWAKYAGGRIRAEKKIACRHRSYAFCFVSPARSHWHNRKIGSSMKSPCSHDNRMSWWQTSLAFKHWCLQVKRWVYPICNDVWIYAYKYTCARCHFLVYLHIVGLCSIKDMVDAAAQKHWPRCQAPPALKEIRKKATERKKDYRARKAELNARISEAPVDAWKVIGC